MVDWCFKSLSSEFILLVSFLMRYDTTHSSSGLESNLSPLKWAVAVNSTSSARHQQPQFALECKHELHSPHETMRGQTTHKKAHGK